MKRHYVYEVKEKITGEFYWGSRTCECDPKLDSYMGSMRSWKPNKANLIKTIVIEYETREKATAAEFIIVKYYIDKKKFPLNRNYNIPGGIFCSTIKGRKLSSESKLRLRGRKQSLEHRKNNADSRRGKPLTEERKKKISESEKGKKLSLEIRQKISNSRKSKGKGIKQPKIKCPHCEKEGGAPAMRQHHFDNCPTFTGKPHKKVTEETKQKISNTFKIKRQSGKM